jgi:hypothetical protein
MDVDKLRARHGEAVICQGGKGRKFLRSMPYCRFWSIFNFFISSCQRHRFKQLLIFFHKIESSIVLGWRWLHNQYSAGEVALEDIFNTCSGSKQSPSPSRQCSPAASGIPVEKHLLYIPVATRVMWSRSSALHNYSQPIFLDLLSHMTPEYWIWTPSHSFFTRMR